MAGLREQATLRPVTRAGRGRSPGQLSSGGPEPRLLTAAPPRRAGGPGCLRGRTLAGVVTVGSSPRSALQASHRGPEC